MRIISQKRDLSIDFDRTPIYVNDNHVLALVEGKERVIGQYETPERAAEVFKRIHNPYSVDELEKDNDLIDFRTGTLSNILVAADGQGRVVRTLWEVFEMPQE